MVINRGGGTVRAKPHFRGHRKRYKGTPLIIGGQGVGVAPSMGEGQGRALKRSAPCKGNYRRAVSPGGTEGRWGGGGREIA